jgi:hypothetical protein
MNVLFQRIRFRDLPVPLRKSIERTLDEFYEVREDYPVAEDERIPPYVFEQHVRWAEDWLDRREILIPALVGHLELAVKIAKQHASILLQANPSDPTAALMVADAEAVITWIRSVHTDVE